MNAQPTPWSSASLTLTLLPCTMPAVSVLTKISLPEESSLKFSCSRPQATPLLGKTQTNPLSKAITLLAWKRETEDD
jgi:hypothetical protein